MNNTESIEQHREYIYFQFFFEKNKELRIFIFIYYIVPV